MAAALLNRGSHCFLILEEGAVLYQFYYLVEFLLVASFVQIHIIADVFDVDKTPFREHEYVLVLVVGIRAYLESANGVGAFIDGVHNCLEHELVVAVPAYD